MTKKLIPMLMLIGVLILSLSIGCTPKKPPSKSKRKRNYRQKTPGFCVTSTDWNGEEGGSPLDARIPVVCMNIADGQ